MIVGHLISYAPVRNRGKLSCICRSVTPS